MATSVRPLPSAFATTRLPPPSMKATCLPSGENAGSCTSVPKSTALPFIRTLAEPSATTTPVPPVALRAAGAAAEGADEAEAVAVAVAVAVAEAEAVVVAALLGAPPVPVVAELEGPACAPAVEPEAEPAWLAHPLTASGAASAAAHIAARAQFFRICPAMSEPSD
ncbi:hypothetical protein ACFQ9X_45290 [Catenulispora yoronensis]